MTAPIAPAPVTPPQPPRAMFSALRLAAGGLSAQRFRMEITAQNLANVETTRTPEGGPYQRRIVRLEAGSDPIAEALTAGDPMAIPPLLPPEIPSPGSSASDPIQGVRVAGIDVDTSTGPMVYDPGHPDADPNGYVRMPNVSMTDELMDLMNARRIYEANATVFQVAKAMLRRAIDI
jgi:flagellar basal-body rod protein FlgC